NSVRSAPEANTLSPAPVMTIERAVLLDVSLLIWRTSSDRTGMERALRFAGWSITRTAWSPRQASLTIAEALSEDSWGIDSSATQYLGAQLLPNPCRRHYFSIC